MKHEMRDFKPANDNATPPRCKKAPQPCVIKSDSQGVGGMLLENEVAQFTTSAGMDKDAKHAILNFHYLKRLPPISHALSVWSEGELVAVVTYGVPPSRHLQKSACPSKPDSVMELNRLWIADHMPRNTASRLVALSLKKMPPKVIVSYADTAAGHLGYVYRACNFNYAGWTDMERKTPRYDYVPANGKHSRDAFRTGEYTRVRRKPKVKYWILSGTRRDKRELMSMVGWPSLDWKTLPPPLPENPVFSGWVATVDLQNLGDANAA